MDKWVPTICMFLSAVLGSAAYFLWTTQMSSASDTITTYVPVEESIEQTKILIVPGHDKDDYGAKYNDLTEEEITLELSQKIQNLLSQNKEFEVYLTRNTEGYTKEFAKYFEEQKEEIIKFIDDHKTETSSLIESGLYEPVQVVKHNPAPEEVAIKLYGINKWANENEIDLIVHVHFNDYPRKDHDRAGKYTGFSLYVPSDNLTGNRESKELAETLQKNLSKFFDGSTLPIEKSVIIENSDLIAVGSNSTLKTSTPILVEYGYIYEDHFYNEEEREENLNRAAEQTYLAIDDLF